MTWIAWPQPSHLKSWTDKDGTAWRRIGKEPLDRKEVRRLYDDPAVRVVLFYGTEPAVVPLDERQALYERMAPVLRRDPGADPFADFVFFKYRDDARNVLLAIEEYC